MQAIGVIPARYASTRFPGKPMASLLQKPMIEWVYRGAEQSQKLSKIFVATDHLEIKSCVESFGGNVIMTDSDLASGSDRVWQAAKDLEADIIVNIQGDEPLITGDLLDKLVSPLESDANLDMSTLACEFKTQSDFDSLNSVKVVLNAKTRALYFSRYPIPHSRLPFAPGGCASLKHIGIYAYKKDFLKMFCEEPPADLEKAESLEQLRALYLGAKINVVKVDHESHGVDSPEDIEKIEQLLKINSER